MKAFAALYNALDSTTRTTEKVSAMVDYFNRVDPQDVIWAIALLTGRRPKRPIRSNDLRSWATEMAGIPAWLFEESYSVVGDLSETISLLLSSGQGCSDKPLHVLMKEIAAVGLKTESEKKEWLFVSWSSFTRHEVFIFNKLISGSFRVGVSAQLVFKALAKAFLMDEKIVAHRLMGNWLPGNTTLQELLLNENDDSRESQPYPFYLAYQLDVSNEQLGDPTEWIIERKYDGIRGQIIVRNNAVHVWSRGEELMSEKFPEFAVLSQILPDGTVLDGEILPFKNGEILSFNEMQKRIGRKNPGKKILNDIPLALMCYDLLEFNHKDIRDQPLWQRRQALEELIKGQSQLLQLSPVLQCSSWQEAETEREKARELACEGLMLKHRDSVYETGRRRGKWWKWKVDPLTVDAVLIYAQAGHGRRANLFTDYTFAVWDGPELVPFTKAYSGLTDKEITEVDAWIKRNTIDKFGPVRSVKAELVFEIAFEGIHPSPRHKSGIALRFPRISRWRKDKKKEEINTKDDLLQLIHSR